MKISKLIKALFLLTFFSTAYATECEESKIENNAEECRMLASQGDAAAQFHLGIMYYYGHGQQFYQDYELAENWYRKAAEQGHALAQFMLGSMYFSGDNVPKNYKEAEGWYRKAAEQGSISAQHFLGHMYNEGLGVSQDYVMAYMWFNLSAENGDAYGISACDKLAKKMTISQIEKAHTIAREWTEMH